MKSPKSSLTLNSFEDLKILLETKSFSLPHFHHPDQKSHEDEQRPELEENLFSIAMKGVAPISRGNVIGRRFQVERSEGPKYKEDAETLSKLQHLVKYGIGFHVSDTPEYVEGTGYHVHPSIAGRLHQGEFAIQAHIDLHGLGVDDAKEVFERFLRESVITGKRGILVIHGRGLSSPSEPVLKKKVIEWLTRGLWRKWVIAFSSARHCDGGAGATYVLLRHRPVSRRLKKGRVASRRSP